MKSLKIACAAAVSIALAGELGLQYSVTAGIITILSIQNTKQETFKRAWKRGIAFLCALAVSFVCFSLMGYTLWAFAMYLLLFAMFCYSMNWGESISTASVLVMHIVAEESFAPALIINEALIFLIGVGVAILVNLHLHSKEEEFGSLAGEADRQMREILHQMSMCLYSKDCMEYETDCFERLTEALKKAGYCAVANYGNTLFRGSTYELDYIRMRERQSVVLREIFENIKRLEYLPKQALQVAELLKEIEQDYRESSTVQGLLERLEDILTDMQGQELPVSREEFEARAILFYILMQLEILLQAKRDFLHNVKAE